MSQMTIEFYEDSPVSVRDGSVIEGVLISSTDVTSASTTVAHASVPDNATYAVVVTDFAAFIEIGSGNQDCTSSRRAFIPANSARAFAVKPTDTLTYRSVA